MMETIVKEWGEEKIICNEPEYCSKYLHISPQKKCSLHYHNQKKETFFVVSGLVRLEWSDFDELLIAGESRTIMPTTLHRFSSLRGATILEISTHHSDEDVVRIEPSGSL